jgi:hypothetical protein
MELHMMTKSEEDPRLHRVLPQVNLYVRRIRNRLEVHLGLGRQIFVHGNPYPIRFWLSEF